MTRQLALTSVVLGLVGCQGLGPAITSALVAFGQDLLGTAAINYTPRYAESVNNLLLAMAQQTTGLAFSDLPEDFLANRRLELQRAEQYRQQQAYAQTQTGQPPGYGYGQSDYGPSGYGDAGYDQSAYGQPSGYDYGQADPGQTPGYEYGQADPEQTSGYEYGPTDPTEPSGYGYDQTAPGPASDYGYGQTDPAQPSGYGYDQTAPEAASGYGDGQPDAGQSTGYASGGYARTDSYGRTDAYGDPSDPAPYGYATRSAGVRSPSAGTRPAAQTFALDVALLAQEVRPDGSIGLRTVDDGDVLRDGGDNLASGDKIKLSFRADCDCYLYVIGIDATGWVTKVYPAPGDPALPLAAHEDYLLPAGRTWWGLDSYKGVEQLYFVLSAARRQDIEQALAALPDTRPDAPRRYESVTSPAVVPTRGLVQVQSAAPTTIPLEQGTMQISPTTFSSSLDSADLVVTRWFHHQ